MSTYKKLREIINSTLSSNLPLEHRNLGQDCAKLLANYFYFENHLSNTYKNLPFVENERVPWLRGLNQPKFNALLEANLKSMYSIDDESASRITSEIINNLEDARVDLDWIQLLFNPGVGDARNRLFKQYQSWFDDYTLETKSPLTTATEAIAAGVIPMVNIEYEDILQAILGNHSTKFDRFESPVCMNPLVYRIKEKPCYLLVFPSKDPKTNKITRANTFNHHPEVSPKDLTELELFDKGVYGEKPYIVAELGTGFAVVCESDNHFEPGDNPAMYEVYYANLIYKQETKSDSGMWQIGFVNCETIRSKRVLNHGGGNKIIEQSAEGFKKNFPAGIDKLSQILQCEECQNVYLNSFDSKSHILQKFARCKCPSKTRTKLGLNSTS